MDQNAVLLAKYFTTWAFVAVLVAVVVQVMLRISGCGATFAASFLVLASTVVGVLGSWVVAQNMCVKGIGTDDAQLSRLSLQLHLYMHMLPMAAALVALLTWRHTCGKPPTGAGVFAAFVGLAVLMGAYLLVPLETGERGVDKVRRVYKIDHPVAFLGTGVGIVGATAGLLLVYGRMLPRSR